MLKLSRSLGVSVLTCLLVLAFAGATDVFAQKKLTYEQAFAKCKEDVTKHVNAGEGMGTAARYARGGACMQIWIPPQAARPARAERPVTV